MQCMMMVSINLRMGLLVVIAQNIPVSIDTCGSSFDTELGVYTLESGSLELQENNDNSFFCPAGFFQSQLIFVLEAGVEYFIVVVRRMMARGVRSVIA